MLTSDLEYALPPERIATTPAEPRDSARLLVAHRDDGRLVHARVRDLPELGILHPGDLMLLNRTRVIPARFTARRERTGGQVRGLFLHEAAEGWHVMLEARGRLTVGETVRLDDNTRLELLRDAGSGQWIARSDSPTSAIDVLERVGETPLPPYILRARKHGQMPELTPEDATRYNTVYAREPGSVAAPTAGLHLTDALLARLRDTGVQLAEVTLHVGIGTFAPVRTDRLDEHRMHRESIRVPSKTIEAIRSNRQRGGRILAVGTTTVRAIESLPEQWASTRDDYLAATDLFIHPDAGFRFRFTDRLLTNFHLPRSTLLAMVATLPGVGLDRLLAWYRVAIDQGYRFYSYGDAMLIV